MRSTAVLVSITALVLMPAFAGTPKTIVLDLQNMTCPVCPITVKRSLEQIPGVEKVTVDFDSKSAVVKFDPDKAAPVALVKATTKAGYPSTIHK